MKFIPELTDEEQEYLQELHKSSSVHRVRERAHAILLSSRGYTIDALADIFTAHRNTVSEWLDLWLLHEGELQELSLEDAPRSGRPLSFTEEQKQVLLNEIGEEPRSLRQVLVDVKKKRQSR